MREEGLGGTQEGEQQTGACCPEGGVGTGHHSINAPRKGLQKQGGKKLMVVNHRVGGRTEPERGKRVVEHFARVEDDERFQANYGR